MYWEYNIFSHFVYYQSFYSVIFVYWPDIPNFKIIKFTNLFFYGSNF